MADKSTQLLLDALTQAAAEPAGLPLHTSKGTPGLFGTTAAAKQVAQRCKDEGYVHVVRTETRGKTAQEVCAITEKGLAYLLHELSPKQVLADLVRALEARQAQAGDLVAAARQSQVSVEALKATVEKVLQQLQKPAPPVGPSASGNGTDTWTGAMLAYLVRWETSGASEDCPLPELYRHAKQASPHVTVGQFHDSLRRLHDQEQIYLHPWTGPLYEIPEPPYALLVGHDIAYYASRRTS
jgi:hypothetical protein